MPLSRTWVAKESLVHDQRIVFQIDHPRWRLWPEILSRKSLTRGISPLTRNMPSNKVCRSDCNNGSSTLCSEFVGRWYLANGKQCAAREQEDAGGTCQEIADTGDRASTVCLVMGSNAVGSPPWCWYPCEEHDGVDAAKSIPPSRERPISLDCCPRYRLHAGAPGRWRQAGVWDADHGRRWPPVMTRRCR